MSRLLREAFAGRSVLVTGHTGFKGSWLALWLHALGARVTGYALPPPTQPSNFELSRVEELLAANHVADIRDGERLTSMLHAAEPEVVFHMAAQALVRDSYARPRETFEVNTLGVVSVLEAVRLCKRPCVVLVITSDKCYENREHVWGYRERDRLGGHDPYSASKGAAEIALAAYRRSFFPSDRLVEHGVKLAAVRAGNVIGGGDWARDRIGADVARALAAGQPVAVRNPRAIRPWQHVLEPLSGYLLLAAHMLASDDPAWCDAWNFGPLPGDDVPVSQLVDMFIAAWGSGQWEDVSDPDQPHEAATLRLSIEKALAVLGWRPRWNVAEAVRRTAAWYRQACIGRGGSMRQACLDDIATYESVEQERRL